MDLAHSLQLGEFVESEHDRLLPPTIRVFLDAIVRHLHVADRYGKEELTAPGLLFQCFKRALAKQRQLHLAHRAFHAEEQAIVGMPRVIDAILIDDQRADQPAELEQRVPVAPVAGEPPRGRGSREASIETTAPTRPSQIAASSFSKPGREIPEPDLPRSSSITSMAPQPRARARSTRPYCRRRLS